MPRAEIASKQALYALAKLHSELAGKLLDNAAERKRLTVGMLQVEAVMKMLSPGYDVRRIAVRRKKLNPWFKRGTVFRLAVDEMRKAEAPLTAREITARMLATRKVADATQKQVRDLTGGVLTSLRNHNGSTVAATVGEFPQRWRLK